MRWAKILEKVWLVAAAVAVIVGIVNYFLGQLFDESVYFPLVVGGFCVLLSRNIRRQWKFKERIDQQQQP